MITLEEEFKKNPELKDEDLNALKEWVAKQPHLPPITEEQLALFLHSCYYRIEPTKSTIDNYFTIRTHAPEIFGNRDPTSKETKEALKTTYFGILPDLTPEGYNVIFFKLARMEPEHYVQIDYIRTHHMVGDILTATKGTVKGHIVAFDMTGISFGHVARINMPVMKKNLFYLQEGVPVRLKGIHFINVVPFIDIIMGMFKPFMSPELHSLFKFHQVGSDAIFEHIPKEMYPGDCGGLGKSLKELNEETIELLEKHKDWFKEEEKQRVDETKRIGKPKNIGDLFGVEGSFKKLSVD